MAPKTIEQFTVVCEGLFLNDTKPKEWNQTFAWKASVGFHYRVLDEAGEPTGETEKKYMKELWLWQAMGGINAQGHFFKLQAEHGEIPGKNGQPAKPYVSVMPIAEVFSDGTARFLEPPKDGKLNVPASSDKPKLDGGGRPPAPGPVKNSNAVGATRVKTKTKEETPGPQDQPKDLNTAKAKGFLDELEKSQSDAWWGFKTQLSYDGADAVNVLDFATKLALMEVSKRVYSDEDIDKNNQLIREDTQQAIDYWVVALRRKLSAMKFSNVRQRFSHLLGLCQSYEHLNKILWKAWCELPASDFDALKLEATVRYKVIQTETKDGVFQGKIMGTLQPELEDIKTDQPESEYPLGGIIDAEEEMTLKTKATDLEDTEITFTVRGINNIQDFKKLMTFWNTTKAALQKNEQVRQAMRLWIADVYMRAKYQANVDGLKLGFKGVGLMTPELEKTLDDRYSQLEVF